MTGGTLIVSRAKKLFPHIKAWAETVGFTNVTITGEEKDSLTFVISDVQPDLMIIESTFYKSATPYMMGRLLKQFPKLNIAVVSLCEYPDDLAVWFIWHGVRSYINLLEGYEEFYNGLQEVKKGSAYISPAVQIIIDETPEWPETTMHPAKRQMEILLMIGNGFDAKRIGDTLHITKRTVQWHINELYRIFHAQNKEELIKTALCMDILTKNDLCFYGKRIRTGKLPAWAEIQQRINRRNIYVCKNQDW